jgi:Clp amino terminal domain, pathogenicity island component/UvrB/uvrC motif
MFERFTEQAQRVMALAQQEARRLNHTYIGTEHLLLGLVHEDDGGAAQALRALGISLAAVRQQVEDVVGQGQREVPPGHLPLARRAKTVLQLSLREALAMGDHDIGTQHILLGLIRAGDGVAAQVLVRLGADLNRVRQQVIRQLHGLQEGGRRPSRPGRAGRPERGLLPEILAQLESIDAQLSALGQRLGPGPEIADLDQPIAQARRGKEAAAGAEDYETAAGLRDQERRLLAEKAARQQEWAAAHPGLASLADELHRLGEGVRQLRDLLGQPGTGPQDSAA